MICFWWQPGVTTPRAPYSSIPTRLSTKPTGVATPRILPPQRAALAPALRGKPLEDFDGVSTGEDDLEKLTVGLTHLNGDQAPAALTVTDKLGERLAGDKLGRTARAVGAHIARARLENPVARVRDSSHARSAVITGRLPRIRPSAPLIAARSAP
jgi:hypothetical protein